MRRKLAKQDGLTLVELLAAVVILTLLGLILNAGLQMAMTSYRAMIAQSETELLLSTLADALTDELRYADDVAPSGSPYTSRSYGADTTLALTAGRACTGAGQQLLPEGAYGKGRYEIDKMEITYSAPVFTIKLDVKEADSTIHAETELTVRCLNP